MTHEETEWDTTEQPRIIASQQSQAGMKINIIVGKEYMSWMRPVEFPETIVPFSSNKEEGAKNTKHYSDGPDELSLWTGQILTWHRKERSKHCLETA